MKPRSIAVGLGSLRARVNRFLIRLDQSPWAYAAVLLVMYWVVGAGLHVRQPGQHANIFFKLCALWLVILAAAFLGMGIAKGRRMPQSKTPGFKTTLWLVIIALSFTVWILSDIWARTLTTAHPLQIPPLVSPRVFVLDYFRLMRDPGSRAGLAPFVS